MGAAEWGMILTMSLLWGGSFYFFKILVAELPFLTIVAARTGIGGLALLLFLLWRRESLRIPAGLALGFLGLGLLNNVIPFWLTAFSETRISSGLAAVLNATTPIFTVLFAHVLTKDQKMTWHTGLGAVFGFIGTAILIDPNAVMGLAQGDFLGEGASLLAGVSYALAAILGQRYAGVAPMTLAAGQVLAAALISVPLALIFEQPWTLPMPGVPVWAALLGLALLSTSFAYVLYFRVLTTAGAMNISIVALLVPVNALFLGWLLLDEVVTLTSLAGMAVIGIGLACIDGRPLKWLRAK